MGNETMKEEKRNINYNCVVISIGFVILLITFWSLFVQHSRLQLEYYNLQSEYMQNLEKIKTLTVTKFKNDIQTTDFSEELIQGNNILFNMKVKGNVHDLSLTTLSDGKKYRVEVIPTYNGEFLGINFPEGEILFGNDGDGKLYIQTENIKEYPYNIELNYLEEIVKICIE